MQINQALNGSGKGIFNTLGEAQNENSDKYSPHIKDKLRHEYDTIIGEPEFIAVRLFSVEYPEYSVRKFK